MSADPTYKAVLAMCGKSPGTATAPAPAAAGSAAPASGFVVVGKEPEPFITLGQLLLLGAVGVGAWWFGRRGGLETGYVTGYAECNESFEDCIPVVDAEESVRRERWLAEAGCNPQRVGFVGAPLDGWSALLADADCDARIAQSVKRDIVRQGHNPPSWVADEDIWQRAKAEVTPSWGEYREPWAVVAHVYDQMGGRRL